MDCSGSGARDLNFYEACVTLDNREAVPDLWLYALSADCHECPYGKIAGVPASNSTSVRVRAERQLWRVVRTTDPREYISASIENASFCDVVPKIGERGEYELGIRRNGTCDLVQLKAPANPYIPLAVAFGLVTLLLSSLAIFKAIKRRWALDESGDGRGGGPKEATGHKKRLRSLDAVRGASILLMIFVNGGAGGYPFLEHATWDGLRVGDLVFPCFMWIMGVCIPISVSSQLKSGASRLSICGAVLKRSLYLFLIGLSLNTLNRIQLEDIRIFGVLQRFGVAYAFAGSVYALTARRRSVEGRWKPLADLAMALPQLAVAVLVVAAHSLVTFRLPVPNCPTGYLGPGGRHLDGKYWNCTGGAAGYLDKILLGERHVYQRPATSSVYGSGPFDPEGVLGCLPSIFQVFLGIHAGQIIRVHAEWRARVLRWLMWAVLFGLVAAALHYGNYVPVNKNLWSLSFVLITTCFSLGLLSVFYLLIDVTGWWEGGPFRIPGMNAIAMYAGHQIFYETFPFHWRIGRMNGHGWLLAESLWCVALWVLVAYAMHRKRIYLKL